MREFFVMILSIDCGVCCLPRGIICLLFFCRPGSVHLSEPPIRSWQYSASVLALYYHAVGAAVHSLAYVRVGTDLDSLTVDWGDSITGIHVARGEIGYAA